MLLEGVNAWSIVTGDETKPGVPAASIQDWEHKETKAKVLLQISVKDNIFPCIRDCTTSKDTWETLKKLYETLNTNRVLFLKNGFFSIKMEVSESIGDFLSRIKKKNLINLVLLVKRFPTVI